MPSNRSQSQPIGFRLRPINGSRFGVRLEFETADIDTIVDICKRHAESILDAFHAAQGLMVVKDLKGIHAPSWIGRSRASVENNEPVLDLLPQ